MTQAARRKILYVEDDPDYREAVRAILEAAGYDVVEASTAEEGLAAFRASPPDAALVDLMMEEVDAGMTLAKELRAAGASIPVFLLSSVGDALSMERALEELGVAAVLQKPIRGETLVGILRSRLG
ncbi:MAG: response regulator [Longimicrobiales bacterium]|nr:response regulator [Longimicrobiales bacterium]